jgi:FtsP/CotA-like multicopper oxidase with cupredoxin domain
MKKRKMMKIVGMSVVTAALLVGCGSGNSNTPTEQEADNSTTSSATNNALLGAVLKGPIDGATVTVYDKNGKSVATTTSSDGLFTLPSIEVASEYYTIVTTNGTYEDEETGETVSMSDTQGLKTLLTKAEFSEMLNNKEYAAMTPETTIFAELVKEKLDAGDDLATAITASEKLIQDLLIKNSSPVSNLQSSDKLLKKGNLVKAGASSPSIALAKNRAISFSKLMKDLGLAPDKVFDIITKIKEDIKDGTEDGIDHDDDPSTADINVSVKTANARDGLFVDTTNRLMSGDISDAEREELGNLGFDVNASRASASSERSAREANLTAEISKYKVSTTLPTLNILKTMTDEDGDLTDAKATYTLTANTNVNVTINTPEGSWKTPMWRYNNEQLPMIIRANRGDAMTLKLDNQLDADSTIHWHGFKIPAIMDGGPDVPVAKGTTKDYTFSMLQPAAPLWFHPHPDMETGKQVYMGLAGVFLLEDDITKKLETDNNLPSGDKDITLLVQDRRFADEANGVRELQYKTMDMDSDGMLGDKVLVNGSIVPKLNVGTAQYRLRLYNVSNARNYDFAFDDNRSFTVVATDGGFLNEPVELTSITLGAAERVEIISDFSNDNVGDKVLMISKVSSSDMMNMGGMSEMSGNNSNTTGMNENNSSMSGTDGNNSNMSGMDGNNSGMGNQNSMGGMRGMASSGQGFVLMRFDVNESVTDDVTLYSTLPTTAEIANRIDPASANNVDNPRQFVMTMARNDGNGSGGMNMSFVINNKTFDMNRVDEFVPAGATEIWEIRNASMMAHPFHAHAVQYQILERNGMTATGTDLGWKDTFLVQPGGSVKIIAKFDPVLSVGDYMYHCHILEHEDAGMMGYFRVGDTGNVGN